MSARVKYGSAFSPVIPSKSTPVLNHPFSIKNLLNLDDQSGEDREENKTITGLPNPASSIARENLPIARLAKENGLAVPTNLNLSDCRWPAWVYATRYSRHGIPPGTFENNKYICCRYFSIVRFYSFAAQSNDTTTC